MKFCLRQASHRWSREDGSGSFPARSSQLLPRGHASLLRIYAVVFLQLLRGMGAVSELGWPPGSRPLAGEANDEHPSAFPNARGLASGFLRFSLRASLGMARGFGPAARRSTAFRHPGLGSPSRPGPGSHRRPSYPLVRRYLRDQGAWHSSPVRPSTRVCGRGSISLRAQSDVHRRLRRPPRSRLGLAVTVDCRVGSRVPPALSSLRAALRRTGSGQSLR